MFVFPSIHVILPHPPPFSPSKEDLQKQTRPDQCLCEDLHEMLPAVKVFADWMMCHPGLWNPPPTVNEEHLVWVQNIVS